MGTPVQSLSDDDDECRFEVTLTWWWPTSCALASYEQQHKHTQHVKHCLRVCFTFR